MAGLGADTLIGGAGADFIGGSLMNGAWDFVRPTALEVSVPDGASTVSEGFGWKVLEFGSTGLGAFVPRAIKGSLTSDSGNEAGDAGNFINAGSGQDWVLAGTGADVVHGDDDNEVIFGLNRNDVLFGDEGNDG